MNNMYQNRQKGLFLFKVLAIKITVQYYQMDQIFPTALHILQEQLKSDHTLIKFSNIDRLEADLKSSGRLFQI